MDPNRKRGKSLGTFQKMRKTQSTATTEHQQQHLYYSSSLLPPPQNPQNTTSTTSKNDDNFVVILPDGYDDPGLRRTRGGEHGFVHGSRAKATDLGTNFVPSRFDVLCSRGKLSWNHEGNVFFRKLVQLNAQRYDAASSRLERSVVVSALVDCIRSRATGFVKQEPKTGMWIEVGDELAREKVGQMMRNILGGFRSSLKSKTAKRKVTLTKLAKRTHDIMASSPSIRAKVDEIERDCGSIVCQMNDDEALELLTKQNLSILAIIKGDEALQKRFAAAEAAAYEHDDDGDDGDDGPRDESNPAAP